MEFPVLHLLDYTFLSQHECRCMVSLNSCFMGSLHVPDDQWSGHLVNLWDLYILHTSPLLDKPVVSINTVLFICVVQVFAHLEEVRRRCCVSCSITLCLIPLRQGLSEPQWSSYPRYKPLLPPQCWDYRCAQLCPTSENMEPALNPRIFCLKVQVACHFLLLVPLGVLRNCNLLHSQHLDFL